MAQGGPAPVPAAANLPNLWKLPAKEAAGPTPWSNWVIRDRVLAGAYPASLDDAETERILTTLLELGTNTFVCLQAEVNINTPDHLWRMGHGLRPYIKDAQKILSRAHETGNPRITQQKIDFLHLPIIDGNVTTDSALNRLAEDCMERVIRGERLYVHCWGGHGRTGTLISVMLGRMYNLPYTSAMRYCQAFHDSRIYPQGVRSPQTPVQRAQVRRLLAAQPSLATPPAMSAPPAPVVKALAPSMYPSPVKPVVTPQQQAPPPRVVAAAGYGANTKPYGSILSSGAVGGVGARGGAGSLNDATAGPRSGITPPSPLKSRPAASVPSNGGYSNGRAGVGESPMKGGGGDGRDQQRNGRSSNNDLIRAAGAGGGAGGGLSAVDRLAADMKQLQSGTPMGAQQARMGIQYGRR